jgi:hypothetical protein
MKKLLLIFAVGSSFLFHSCDEYRNFTPLVTFDFVIDNCHRELIDGRFIIATDSLYQEVMETFEVDDTCTSTSLPSIDFTTYSLLGYYKCGSGCETNFNRKLYLDEENKKYIYDVEVESVGGCEPWVCRMNWVLVPALPDGYFVEFF